MKKLILNLSILFFLLLSVSAYAKGARYSVNTPFVNIRNGPGSQFEVLWKAEKNYPLELIQDKGKWALFKDFEGYKGWVYKPLLSKTKSAIIKVGKCNVRKGPSKKYKILFIAKKGTPFLVVDEKNGWYKLKHADGDTGWAKKNLLW